MVSMETLIDPTIALYTVLSHDCAKVVHEDGVYEHHLFLHCQQAIVMARPVEPITDDNGDYIYTRYDILSVEFVG